MTIEQWIMMVLGMIFLALSASILTSIVIQFVELAVKMKEGKREVDKDGT